MERIPVWVWGLAALLFAGLAVWSATDENWAGVIAGVALAIVCIAAMLRRSRGPAT